MAGCSLMKKIFLLVLRSSLLYNNLFNRLAKEYEPGCITTIKLLLRRTLVRSVILFSTPLSPSLSPLGKERCCITNPNFKSSTSTSILYSPFLKTPFYRSFQTAWAVRRWPSPTGEGRDEAQSSVVFPTTFNPPGHCLLMIRSPFNFFGSIFTYFILCLLHV